MASRFHVLSSAAVVVIVAVALVGAVKQLPHSLRMAQQQVNANAGRSDGDRELAPLQAYGVHEALVLRAAQIIPRNAVFYVATGGQSAGVAASGLYAYWLLPRRHTNYADSADWIVDWEGDPSQLGVKTKVIADLGGGALVLRVVK